MANTTTNLTNINLLTKAQYDAIQSPATDELWAVEIPVVVETYDDGNGNWYRLWSDGWVEQGGVLSSSLWSSVNSFITLTFLKPFMNTTYTFLKTISSNYQSNLNAMNFAYNNKTTSTISVGGCPSNYINEQNWYACGYAASSN